jgi:hypothetical protein
MYSSHDQSLKAATFLSHHHPTNRSASRVARSDDGPPKNQSMQRLPMTTTAAPIASAAKQEQHQNDNEDQLHGDSPQMATAAFAAQED